MHKADGTVAVLIELKVRKPAYTLSVHFCCPLRILAYLAWTFRTIEAMIGLAHRTISIGQRDMAINALSPHINNTKEMFPIITFTFPMNKSG